MSTRPRCPVCRGRDYYLENEKPFCLRCGLPWKPHETEETEADHAPPAAAPDPVAAYCRAEGWVSSLVVCVFAALLVGWLLAILLQ